MSENIKGPGQIGESFPDPRGGALAVPTPGRPIADVVSTSDKVLFWASFLTLIAAGMGFTVRGDILGAWGAQFGFTQFDLGEITGMGLVGFGATILFFSFFADIVGYGTLMVIAFLLHVTAVVLTFLAPFAFEQWGWGKEGAYWLLYLGQLSFSLANGTCEAVINPLTASLFPRNKTHWLNILHAGWPAGLVLGALVGLAINQIPVVKDYWQVKWAIVLLPMLMYGGMMFGRKFPHSEAKASGVTMSQMLKEVGLLGASVVVVLLGLWMTSVLADLNKPYLPSWIGWIAAAGLLVAFGFASEFKIGPWMLAFLLIIHGMIGYVELGTDSWIIDITKTVLNNSDMALYAFVWTNLLMTALRFFAGPIVHKISPVGLLFVSAVLGTTGLYLLGLPATKTAWLWLGAVTVYGVGKTFYWPTMLGVISERFPRGGALALGMSGGVGMLSAGLLGGPGIGYFQDYAAVKQIKDTPTYPRYESYKVQKQPTIKDYYVLDDLGSKEPEQKAFLAFTGLFPRVAGLDNTKVGVLLGDPGENNGMGKKLEVDIKNYTKGGAKLEDNPTLYHLEQWWEKEGKPNSATDEPVVKSARVDGGKQALTWTAYVPATMACCYLLLVLYFLAIGGYKAAVLIGHKADDEKFTGGTEGPGEG
jgi:MFS family permease